MYSIHYTENKTPRTAYENNLSTAITYAKELAKQNLCYACVADTRDNIIYAFHGKHCK